MREAVRYTVLLHKDGPNSLWAEVEELPGCFVSGATITEIQEALAEAIGLYLSTPDATVEINHVEWEENGLHATDADDVRVLVTG